MLVKTLLQRYARYNQWAHKRLLDLIKNLSTEQHHAVVPSSFNSLDAIQLTTTRRLCVSTGTIKFGRRDGRNFYRDRLVVCGSFGCNQVEQPARSARYIEFI